MAGSATRATPPSSTARRSAARASPRSPVAASSPARATAPDKSQCIGPAHPPRVRTGSQLAGDAAERLVAERLRAAGWTILGLNVHVGRAELDIVAIDPAPPAP